MLLLPSSFTVGTQPVRARASPVCRGCSRFCADPFNRGVFPDCPQAEGKLPFVFLLLVGDLPRTSSKGKGVLLLVGVPRDYINAGGHIHNLSQLLVLNEQEISSFWKSSVFGHSFI